MKRLFVLSVLIIAMLWGCTQVNEDTPATEEKNASYKVEHYQQNITDDEYTLVETDSENKNGVTGEETSAQAKTYEGFTAKTIEQVKITADGSSVVKIYYDRNEITLTLNLDGGEGQTEITGKYGATVNVTVPIKTGYTFIGWNTALPTTFPAISTTYKATWTANKSGITITLPSINDAEINLQQVTNENTVTFTAADGFDSYAWYIDGVKQSETSATFAIDTSTIDPANYKIMVIVADGNKYHSATADLEIRN